MTRFNFRMGRHEVTELSRVTDSHSHNLSVQLSQLVPLLFIMSLSVCHSNMAGMLRMAGIYFMKNQGKILLYEVKHVREKMGHVDDSISI